MTPTKFNLYFLAIILILSSCTSPDNRSKERTIFHADPMQGGISTLYLDLYEDHTYQICNGVKIEGDCHTGKFTLDKDTLTLLNLDNKIPLLSNKLLIVQYAAKDSTYWKWKYSGNPNPWQDLQQLDTTMAVGDLYQLDRNNKLINDKNVQQFTITLDSLKNKR